MLAAIVLGVAQHRCAGGRDHAGRIPEFGQDTTLLFVADVMGLLERVRQRRV